VAFRWLIFSFTWLATGHRQFGQQGHAPSLHLPWLGVFFVLVVPVVGGLLYGPLIHRFAREARGHGVPEVMLAVAENGGRIRPPGDDRQSARLGNVHRRRRIGGPRGSDRPDRRGARLAAQAPLTSIASVVEMTGNFTLTVPVMLATGIAAALSKRLTYGSIDTTKLLRRGIDIERPRTHVCQICAREFTRSFRRRGLSRSARGS
jgi:H+/Cl- antiporter ClcA